MAIVRYTFTGTLRLTGALHVGSGGSGRIGAGEAATDATIIRDSRGRPYIPGSSLRGVLRSAISQIAPVLFDDPALMELHDEELYFANLKRDVERHVATIRDRTANTPEIFDTEAERQTYLESRLTPIERLFGSVLWASPVLIPDLHLADANIHHGEIRHGVGIDRDTGAARDAIKYDFEVLPAGARFDFWMRCDIPTQPRDYQVIWSRLLALGLQLLQQGDLTLGGRAARGVGQVQLNDLQVYRLDLGNRAAVIDSLLGESSAARYGAVLPADWIRTVLQEAR